MSSVDRAAVQLRSIIYKLLDSRCQFSNSPLSWDAVLQGFECGIDGLVTPHSIFLIRFNTDLSLELPIDERPDYINYDIMLCDVSEVWDSMPDYHHEGDVGVNINDGEFEFKFSRTELRAALTMVCRTLHSDSVKTVAAWFPGSGGMHLLSINLPCYVDPDHGVPMVSEHGSMRTAVALPEIGR